VAALTPTPQPYPAMSSPHPVGFLLVHLPRQPLRQQRPHLVRGDTPRRSFTGPLSVSDAIEHASMYFRALVLGQPRDAVIVREDLEHLAEIDRTVRLDKCLVVIPQKLFTLLVDERVTLTGNRPNPTFQRSC
jgi:hypothetical protein